MTDTVRLHYSSSVLKNYFDAKNNTSRSVYWQNIVSRVGSLIVSPLHLRRSMFQTAKADNSVLVMAASVIDNSV